MRRNDDSFLDWGASCSTPPTATDIVVGGLLAGEIGVLLNFASYGRAWLSMSMAAAVAGCLPIAPGKAKSAIAAPKSSGRVLLARAYDTVEHTHRSIFLFSHWLRQQQASGALALPKNFDPKNIGQNLMVSALRVPQPLVVPGTKHDEWGMGPAETWLRRATDGVRLTILDPVWHDFNEQDPAPMAALVNVLFHISNKTGTAFLVTHQATSPLSPGLALLAERASWVISLHPMSPKAAAHFNISRETERHRWIRLVETKGLPETRTDCWLYLDAKGALVYANPAVGADPANQPQLPGSPSVQPSSRVPGPFRS